MANESEHLNHFNALLIMKINLYYELIKPKFGTKPSSKSIYLLIKIDTKLCKTKKIV